LNASRIVSFVAFSFAMISPLGLYGPDTPSLLLHTEIWSLAGMLDTSSSALMFPVITLEMQSDSSEGCG